MILTNTHNSISVLIFAKAGGRKINLRLRDQLIKPNLRGKGVISFSHMNSYLSKYLSNLFKQQYATFQEKYLFWGLILANFFDLSIQYKINPHILVKINPKSRFFHENFHTAV